MFSIKYDKGKRRIYIAISGTLEGYEPECYTKEILSVISKLQSGFTVCCDLSRADFSVLNNSARFQHIRDYAALKGLKKSATIISPEASEAIDKNSPAALRNTFVCKEEAEKYLDE